MVAKKLALSPAKVVTVVTDIGVVKTRLFLSIVGGNRCNQFLATLWRRSGRRLDFPPYRIDLNPVDFAGTGEADLAFANVTQDGLRVALGDGAVAAAATGAIRDHVAE